MPILMLLIVAGWGCGTSKPKGASSQSLAAVVIYSSTPPQIQQAALEVFQAEHYNVLQSSPTRMVFEKPGSRMNQMAYSGWFEGEVWVRAKLNIKSYDAHSHLVECEVFVVRDHGESFFEEESRAFGYKKRPFQELLNQLKSRLN